MGDCGAVGLDDVFECGDVAEAWCMRDSESICRTLDVSDSRLAFGIGEFLAVLVVMVTVAPLLTDARCVGDTFGVDVGIDELLRVVLFNDKSLRRLCADSGRYRFGDVEHGIF